MDVYVCNQGWHIFEAELCPDKCPLYEKGLKRRGSVSMLTDYDSWITIPVKPKIRKATREEKSIYLKMKKEKEKKQKETKHKRNKQLVIESLKMLKDYKLSPDEYNMALILCYYMDEPDPIFRRLDKILHCKEYYKRSKAPEERLSRFYDLYERDFKKDLINECRDLNVKDVREAAKKTEKDSAANIFLKFKKGKSWKSSPLTLSYKVIRGIDNNNLAGNPGEDYLKLISKWYEEVVGQE